MDDGEVFRLILGCVVVLVPLGWLVWRKLLWPQFRVDSALSKLPRRTVATLVAGERCCLVGTVHCAQPAEAIGSRRPCILYTSRSSDDSRTDVPVTLAVDFELEDATGRVAVSAREVDADILDSWSGSLGGNGADPPTFGATVIARESMATYGSMYIEEGIVAPGQRVAIGGLVERVAGNQIRLVGNSRQPLLLLDRGRLLD